MTYSLQFIKFAYLLYMIVSAAGAAHSLISENGKILQTQNVKYFFRATKCISNSYNLTIQELQVLFDEIFF